MFKDEVIQALTWWSGLLRSSSLRSKGLKHKVLESFAISNDGEKLLWNDDTGKCLLMPWIELVDLTCHCMK